MAVSGPKNIYDRDGIVMSVIYSIPCINNRLLGVVTTIDAGAGNGLLVLLAGSTVICSITLQKPSGTASGGVLTFTAPLLGTAAAAGSVTTAQLLDSTGAVVVSGLTAGIPLSGADVIISNGLNSTFINTAQSVQILSAQITGS